MVDKQDAVRSTESPSASGAKAKKEPLPQDFETALAQLEALVAQMESGSLPLEQSLAAYEKGVDLARICQNLLDSAEQQVKVLQGNLLKPFAQTPDGGED
ncbi:MAG TPA: exodeoxyribonuclease VII small subunit [Eoetvoesiella sp.]|uniref:exodeoxyribonuclease VII small subunit n=1 Tax=Eoetvoesiella sp. TaxID=1966355 RepID=UPI002CB3927F|nr:exodeoxyribonuclease VII small subunit [Eoetvoesiella sp.]HWK63025.1 exodeoxyribonuclease VII small subunit [Eoetvoesiella sp.]